MCRIGTAKAVERLTVKFGGQNGEIIAGNDAVAVKKHEIISRGTVYSVITGYGTALVGLVEITHVHLSGETSDKVAARLGRSVLDNDHFKITACLGRQALKKVVDLIHTVIHRDYN